MMTIISVEEILIVFVMAALWATILFISWGYNHTGFKYWATLVTGSVIIGLWIAFIFS